MKFNEILENILDMGNENKLNEPPQGKPNYAVLENKIKDAISRISIRNVDVKVTGPTVQFTRNGKTSTFNTSHVMKYLNDPFALNQMILKKGYYE